MKNKRLVIAGSRSGVGKTTISLGLMAALTNRGYEVQPYKVGPDYIDPGFHTLVTDNPSYNLDSYFLGEKGVKEVFADNTANSFISIIEGVMGLFDGKGKESTSSTAEIAKILNSPVVLVVDGKKMAQSGAALAYGYKNYDSELDVRGIILNNIGSQRHYQLLKEAIESKPVNLEVLGYLLRQDKLELPERHLGLVPTQESKDLNNYISKLVKLIERNIDIEKILEIADKSLEINQEKKKLYKKEEKYNVDLGIAYDQAFNFYYQYNLDVLEEMGANLIYFSPLKDNNLPKVDGIYLGGGFPESFLKQLESNRSMKKDIFKKAQKGMPVYAECGGLMYLSDLIVDLKKNKYKMAGLISGQIEMKDSLQEMGYKEIEVVKDNVILNKGEKARGHVFHYSKISKISKEVKKCYKLKKDKLEGYSSKFNVLASYLHLHFGSNLNIVNRFLHTAKKFKKNNFA